MAAEKNPQGKTSSVIATDPVDRELDAFDPREVDYTVPVKGYPDGFDPLGDGKPLKVGKPGAKKSKRR